MGLMGSLMQSLTHFSYLFLFFGWGDGGPRKKIELKGAFHNKNDKSFNTTRPPPPPKKKRGSRDGAVVENSPPMQASHQCRPCSIPGLRVICGLSLLLLLYSALRGFSPGTLVFPSPQKPTFLNSKSIWNSRAMGLSVVLLVSRTVKCHPR